VWRVPFRAAIRGKGVMAPEPAYKRLLRFFAAQPSGEAELFPITSSYSRKALAKSIDRGLIERMETVGWVARYRITDAGRAEVDG